MINEILGPLPWLIAFANLGIDRRQAGGREDKLLESRALALGVGTGERQGYTLDPQSPRTILQTTPVGERITQKRGGKRNGTLMSWYSRRTGTPLPTMTVTGVDGAPIEFRLPADRNLSPIPERVAAPPAVTFVEGLKGDLGDFPRPRDLMRIPPGGITWTPAPTSAEQAEEYRRRFCFVHNQVIQALSCCWYVHAGRYDIWGEVLVTAIDAIGQSCFGRPGPPQLPAAHYERVQRGSPEDLGFAYSNERLFREICSNRGPIWIVPTAGLETEYVADAMPGIAWAEVLNLLEHYWPTVGHLGWCGWCGGFFPLRRGRGRPRDFCSDECRQRFNGRSIDERRSSDPA
jgi:hypothetical protein